jgi:hypothetical protein
MFHVIATVRIIAHTFFHVVLATLTIDGAIYATVTTLWKYNNA